MADQQQRNAERTLQDVELDAEFLAECRIESRERLVQKQCFGIGDQGTRDSDALALTARKLMGVLVGNGRQPKACDPAFHLWVAVTSPRIPQAGRKSEADVLPDVKVRKQRVVLEHDAQPPFPRGKIDAAGRVEQRPTGKAHVTGLRSNKTRDGVQEQGFSRA